MSDTLLIEQCRAHNPKAQMQLYKQYCEGMFIVASRYMKDAAAAEDALQEAFIKAFTKLHQYKGDVTFGACLKRPLTFITMAVVRVASCLKSW